MPIIQASNLAKSYKVYQKKTGLLGAITGLFSRDFKEVKAVSGVSFSIEPGEMVAFLGPNGAGKTTTLKMLSGLIYPTSGTAEVLGYTPWERPDAFRRQFALVMGQKNQLWWDLPAADSFELHREIYSLDKADYSQTVGELIEMFNVQDHVRQPVRELSLGERMKMELIASLLHKPKLLLLDEPTIGLDVLAQVAIQKCLREYNERRNVTMLLTSHYMRDVEALAKRVLVITSGSVVYDGSLDDLHDIFGNTKLMKLQFAEPPAETELSQLATIIKQEGTLIDLEIEKDNVPQVLEYILQNFKILDMNIEDPPLDKVIAHVFEQGGVTNASN